MCDICPVLLIAYMDSELNKSYGWNWIGNMICFEKLVVVFQIICCEYKTMPNITDNNLGSTQNSRIVRVRDVSFFDYELKYLFFLIFNISYQSIMMIFIDLFHEQMMINKNK